MEQLDYQQTAKRIKLLAHPERLRILDVLRREAECVCHLESLMDKPQPYISQQLGLLRKAGIIEDEKDGLNVYYRLVDPDIMAWLEVILGPAIGDHPDMVRHKQLAHCPCPKCETATGPISQPVELVSFSEAPS